MTTGNLHTRDGEVKCQHLPPAAHCSLAHRHPMCREALPEIGRRLTRRWRALVGWAEPPSLRVLFHHDRTASVHVAAASPLAVASLRALMRTLATTPCGTALNLASATDAAFVVVVRRASFRADLRARTERLASAIKDDLLEVALVDVPANTAEAPRHAAHVGAEVLI